MVAAASEGKIENKPESVQDLQLDNGEADEVGEKSKPMKASNGASS